ncbi:MAG TPA: DNA polymerase III subunit delta [Chloroflexota bacterium]|nr:DNA polymerase III subunit delta [Chloroflexota bacterium]
MPGFIYLLYGADHFSRDEQVRALKEKMRALPAGEHNLSDLRGTEATQADVLEACCAAPFLADRRMVIAEGLLARVQGPAPVRRRKKTEVPDGTAFYDALQSIPESTALVLVEEHADSAILNELRQRIPTERLVARAFERRDDLGAWIRQRVKLGGGAIEPDAVRQLLQLASDDTALIANEVEKLLAYCSDRPITATDVAELVTVNSELSAFALLDALADGDRGAALSTYRQLLHQGERPESILPQIAAFVRRLAIIRAAIDENRSLSEAASAAQINPRTVDRLRRQASRFTPTQLREAYGLLLDADLQIKTSGRGPIVAVELVIAEFPMPERATASGGNRAGAGQPLVRR